MQQDGPTLSNRAFLPLEEQNLETWEDARAYSFEANPHADLQIARTCQSETRILGKETAAGYSSRRITQVLHKENNAAVRCAAGKQPLRMSHQSAIHSLLCS